MSQHPSELNFRFQYVNRSGRATGWWPAGGSLTQDAIQLKDQSLSYRAVLNSTCRDRRLILTLDPREVSSEKITEHLIDGNGLLLEVSGAKTNDLELFIDRISSRYLADKHRAALEQEGKGHEFRSITCPHCGSTVDLSLLNKTSFVYCRFCETIFQEHGDLKTLGTTYRLCDECGWFDRVQGYTEFYFYFLLVVYGFSWKRRHLCDNCVKGVFWKVLLINLIFILGIFPALWMKIKSLGGRDKDLQKLARANALGKQGKCEQAAPLYAELRERYPRHPGLLFSESLSHLKGQDGAGTWRLLEDSLRGCSNYGPSVRLMNRLQEAATQAPKN